MSHRRRRPRAVSPAVAAVLQQVARVFGTVELVACRNPAARRAPETPLLALDVAAEPSARRDAADRDR